MSLDQPPVPWRRIVISGYGPTLLASIGFGAVAPLIVLTARELGASVGLAALITALLGLGQLAGDLPAGWLTTRLGEKRAIVAACVVDALALVAIFFADTLPLLAAAVFVDGMVGAVFGLARQTWLTEAIPLRYRARSLSSLGGTFRIGFVIGPLVGAVVIARWGMAPAFLFAAAMSVLAALVTLALPDLPPPPQRDHTTASSPTGTFAVLRAHRRALVTAGTGVFALMMIRSARQSIVPLWCDQQGVSAATTSVIFAVSMAFDVLLFFPGGAIMDRLGRWYVCVPAMITMGVGLALLPLTHTPVMIGAVAALLGVGNGVSSGIVMTLGADFSPAVGRAQFLAGWRLCADAGNSTGPLMITMITAVGPLGAASVALAALAWVGAAWLGRFVPGPRPRLAHRARVTRVSGDE